MMKPTIAIIGTGISGLSLAHHLREHATIKMFEKSRGVGGRMSTRYSDAFQFDHGAQFFTARSKLFKTFLHPFIANGTVNEWKPKIVTLEKGKKPYKRLWYEPHYVASPKMNKLCKALARNQNIQLNTHIMKLSQTNNDWYLTDQAQVEHGPFDWVLSTAPAPQTSALFPDTFNEYEDIVNTSMTGCYCLMLGINKKQPLPWGCAKVKHSPIAWIAIDSSKPDRHNHSSIVIHTTNKWAEEHIEKDKNTVLDILIQEFEVLTGIKMSDLDYQELHRWRYANTEVNKDSEEEPMGYVMDSSLKLAASGDWCLKGQIESAYLSGYYLANAFKQAESS